MFSLQVGLTDGSVPDGRMFEYTDTVIRDEYSSNFPSLQDLPVLAMPEVGDSRSEQIAHIGSVRKVRRDGREHRFAFVRDPDFPAIPLATIKEIAGELGISNWELQRTHWAVKNVDLFQVLYAHEMRAHQPLPGNFGAAGAVQFPIDSPRDPKLVAVMMPFAPAFDVVYETIQSAATDAGLRCVRAADIWQYDHVMGDILSLLWRSQIVIADLTGKNPNVFYEAGLAHALPRSTVLLTQDAADIPFDLQSIRYLAYGLGTAQRASLRRQLAERLTTLINI